VSKMIQSIPAAKGIALGKVFWLHDVKLIIERKDSSPVAELERLENARQKTRSSISEMKAGMSSHPEEAAIFDAHMMMLDDPDLLALVETQLTAGAEFAWDFAIQEYAAKMEALEDDYFRARANDIRDIGKQVLRNLLGVPDLDLSQLRELIILLAKDLTPSDTCRMDKSKILGFATQEGSSTSHTAILAKALNLPAVVGVGPVLEEIPDNAFIILDGSTGKIIIEPNEATLRFYSEKKEIEYKSKLNSLGSAHQPAITSDGKRVEVVANIGNKEDALQAINNGAEGVGLLRTEFLYMDRKTPPSEPEQLEVLNSILDVMGSLPVVIRTLDIGGDKYPAYMDLGSEVNPFLGWRAIRVCLDRPEFFKTQLRAILSAAPGHDVRIMFPMISTLEELRAVKTLLAEARSELNSVAEVSVGIMVEIPSVVQMVDQFVKEVDFFSVGTNDLTQYTFAVDRTNPKVASIADACHPAILRQIRQVIEIAHANNIWVGVCGELAGDAEAIPVLLGMGLDEFSMSPGSIPVAKEIIRGWDTVNARSLADIALNLESAAAVRELVKNRSGGTGLL